MGRTVTFEIALVTTTAGMTPIETTVGMALMRSTIVLLTSLTCQFLVNSNELYQKRLNTCGQEMCALDQPSNATEVHRVGTSCVPLCVICAWKCDQLRNCVGYNWREDSSRCELFSYMPAQFSIVSGCSHFKVHTIYLHFILNLHPATFRHNLIRQPGVY